MHSCTTCTWRTVMPKSRIGCLMFSQSLQYLAAIFEDLQHVIAFFHHRTQVGGESYVVCVNWNRRSIVRSIKIYMRRRYRLRFTTVRPMSAMFPRAFSMSSAMFMAAMVGRRPMSSSRASLVTFMWSIPLSRHILAFETISYKCKNVTASGF